ncbi:MAG: serine hydrolase [Gemmatimonadota bacterium]|nr:serine hydrolase [Gemmatimonadota bacterium]
MKLSTSRVTAGLAAVFASTACGPPISEAEARARVDAIFADYASPSGPGCSLGVIRDGDLVLAAGYGSADLDHGIANGPETVFRIASVSKQVTAGAIALLAVRGELDLDAPVQRYIPEFPDYPDPPTVRHLVHHTSGVREYLTIVSLAGYRDDDSYGNPEALAAITRQRELVFPPGDRQQYSNSGYILLGEIVARVSGRSLRDFAEANFFGPLGMTQTHFHDDHNEIVPNRATGYAPMRPGSTDPDRAPTDGAGAGDPGGAFEISVTTLDVVGDGGVFTSVEDWVAWDRNLSEGTVGGTEWVALMHQRGVLNSGDTIPYAFGLSHGEHGGLATVGHTGSWVGYRTAMSRYPETGHSFVAFCNRSRISPGRLIESVAEVYLEERMAPAAQEEAPEGADAAAEEEAPEAEPSAAPPEPAEEPAAPEPESAIPARARYAGSFYSPELAATYRIVEDGASGLTLHVGRSEPASLLAAADGVLTTEWGMTLRFSDLVEGRYRAILLDAGRVRNLRFSRN